MAIHAYDELYLASAQNILGHATDFAIMTLELAPNTWGNAFAISPIARQFAKGNPLYVAGLSGCELAREILDNAHIRYQDSEDTMYLDKSPEFWAGWALACYQWLSCRSFQEILSAVPLEDMIDMYPLYHEMDTLHFIEAMQQKVKAAFPFTRLRYMRDNNGLTQAELAAYAEVPLRQIQLFEQRQRNINKTESLTLYKLSLALNCDMEDLLEHE